MGDDSVGIKIVEIMESAFKNPGVRFYRLFNDFLSLFEIFESSEAVIIVDAIKGGGEEGTVYVFEGVDDLINCGANLSTHTLNLKEVVHIFGVIKGKKPTVYIAGIEPSLYTEGCSVSERVEGKIPLLLNLVGEIVKRHIQD